MRPHVKLGTRALATLVFFFGFPLLSSGLAYSAQTIPVHTYSGVEAHLNAESKYRVEQAQPAGTRVYYYDYYSITYGPKGANSALLTTDTTFSRDRNGVLYATDIGSGVTYAHFPRDATIERENNLGEKFVRPGASLDSVFQRLIWLGGARFAKVL